MTFHYPDSYASIRSWANENGVTPTEAKKRFAQYAILLGIASSNALRSALVFKGGNALNFVWQPNRSTTDLDFSVDMEAITESFEVSSLATLLTRCLTVPQRRLGVTLRVHKVERQPPGPDKTFVTYAVSIGYALEDESKLRQKMEKGDASPNVIRLDISINEPICEAQPVKLEDRYELRVCTIEDIVAEKLRALLQQPIRNRERKQDLLDIAVILRNHPGLDKQKIAEYLQEKADAREVPVSRAAFMHPEVAERASRDYETLQTTTRVFVPFNEAMEELYSLIESLPIS